jgi:hypothetical protein
MRIASVLHHRYERARLGVRSSSTVLALALMTVTAAGCTDSSPQPASSDKISKPAPPDPSTPSASLDPTSPSASPEEDGLPQGDEAVALDPAQFTTQIDNPYWPMKPGTRWTSRETDAEGTVQKVVVVVTRQTKEITNGVTARVVRDTVTESGQLVEDTRDWYAQDQEGNIWYLGEDTAEFENGEITTRAGSFEAGVDGALPGIVIPANPTPGMKYRQEYYKGEAEDNGEVLSTNEMAEVPVGLFMDALLTKDTNPLEPKVLEYKLYAKGVGPVLVLDVSGGAGREELIKMDQAPRTAGTGPLGNPNP